MMSIFQQYEKHKILSMNCCWNNHFLLFIVLGKVTCLNVELLNEIEIFPYRKKKNYWPHDAFTAASFLFPEKKIQKCNPYNATMELHGYYTRGEMFVNRQSTDHNVFIIEKISGDEFKAAMLWAANFN